MEISIEELNETAMQIILHAGNCRTILNDALHELIAEGNDPEVDAKLKEAKKEITLAHKIQTDMIQSTIENEKLQTTLLFTHAQDTLMTINSEMFLAHHMVQMYRRLKNQEV